MALSSNNIVTRGVLQNVSQKYSNIEYIAERIFPTIDGLTRKSQVVKYNKGPWFRDEAEVRGRGAAARLVDFRVSLSNITPVNYAAAAKVPDEDRADAKEAQSIPIQPDIDALELIANKLDLKKEVRVSAAIHAGTWADGNVGGEDAAAGWGHATAGSDTFLADMKTGRDAIRAATGLLPNRLLLDYTTWSKLAQAPALLALTSPTKIDKSNPFMTLDTLATLAQVKEVIVGTALKATNEEALGNPDAGLTTVDVWNNSDNKGTGFLFYTPERAGLKVASAGYMYRLAQTNGQGRMSSTWRKDEMHSDFYDTQEDLDIVTVGLDLGYLWKDTIAT